MNDKFFKGLRSTNKEIIISNKITDSKVVSLSDVQDDIKNAVEKYAKEHDYIVEIYPDRDDKLDSNDIDDILRADHSPQDVFYEILDDRYDMYYDRSYDYDEIIENLDLADEVKEEYKQDIIELIDENMSWQVDYDHYSDVDVKVDVYTNIDTVDSKELLIFNDEGQLEALAEPITWLIEKQGYSVGEFIDYYNSLEDKENPDAGSFFGSLLSEINESYYDGYCEFVFLGNINLKEFIEAGKNSIVIPKTTMCGLVNTGHGAGAPLEVKLEKDINLPIKDVVIMSYDGYHYNVDEIYGLVKSAWDTHFVLK